MTPPDITEKSADGFADLSFALESRERNPAGGERLVANGVDGDRPVSFAIVIEPDWTESKFSGVVLRKGQVVIESLGPSSDALVQAIDRLYETQFGVQRMQRATRFTGISLEGDPSHLDAARTRIKLFFESEAQDRYAEIFLNIDMQTQSIELNEKDVFYRNAIVLALTAC